MLYLGSYTDAFYVGGACELIGCFLLAIIPAINKKYNPRSPSSDHFPYLSSATERDSLTEFDALKHKTDKVKSHNLQHKVVDVGNHHGFLAVPPDSNEDCRVQNNIPVIFMKSNIPTISSIIDRPTVYTKVCSDLEKHSVAIIQVTNTQETNPSETKDKAANIKPERKTLNNIATVVQDKASTIASHISNKVVETAQNVIAKASTNQKTSEINPQPRLKQKNPKPPFAVIPYFASSTSKSYKIRFSHRYGVHENAAAVSRSYDTVSPHEIDFHLEAGAVEQSHMASLHNYFHDMVKEEPHESSKNVRKHNLLKYVFKKKTESSSPGKRTSLSFSSVENILSSTASVLKHSK